MSASIESWIDNSSNQQQQYLTHGAFRYFGKLPPTVGWHGSLYVAGDWWRLARVAKATRS